jgi:diguanylate cyclase (GGDEF)-like protein
MPVRSFQAKLLYLMIAVLLLLQAATLIAVHITGQRTMRRSVAEELTVGGRVLDRILYGRGQQLSDTVRVLASDFAFREAIASGDRPTITSVLTNHGSRIHADAAVLISLQGSVVASTVGGSAEGHPFPIPALMRAAQARGEASAIASFGGRPYQLVVVPVLAPRPIAWVCMGFVINRNVLDEVRRLTALDVSLLTAAGEQSSLISTLPTASHNALRAAASGDDGASREESIPIGGDEYQTLHHPLRTADHSRIDTLLHRSIAEAARPYRTLELKIFVLSTLALIVALIAAMFFARGVSRPLESLAAGASRIGRGDYAEPIAVQQHDEIGRLAEAFDHMRTGIAEREDRIRYQATHDALTGLPNRVLFLQSLGAAIARAKAGGETVAIIMMDLDRFKEINDTLGHHFGDELLKEVGRRLTETLRESDTVARLGGDEFALTFIARDVTHARNVARRIGVALEESYLLAGVSIEVSASMGIALCPTHAEDADTLMKRADVAMYDAKRNHSSFATYEPGRDAHSMRRLTILSELRNAVSRDELELHYQPKIDVKNDKAVHAEALVRWRHPVHGILAPDEFVPLAEQSGNIGMITKWVLKRAIRDCGGWNAAGLNLTIAVNLSALDLFDAKLPSYIDSLLREAALPASQLVLEITESAVMKDPGYAAKILSELKSRGVTLSIDDYGTGYSSLAHLKRLPVDELKIDKSFVMNLLDSSNGDLLIVRSTIELGHNMGLRVIAEGVENAETWRILKDLGCDMAQGYYVSPPLPLKEFREWFTRFAVGRALLYDTATELPAAPRLTRSEPSANRPVR